MDAGGERSPYPGFRSRPERVALAVVLAVIVGIPLAVLGYRLLESRLQAVRVVDVTARVPDPVHKGWTPETIVIRKGERVRLRLTSLDVVHGFAIPKLGVEVKWVEPGKVKDVEILAEQAGRYAFLCTVWCELGHWRMRGTLEVVDPADPTVTLRDVDPPRTDWTAAGLDLDAEHRSPLVPAGRPEAQRGGDLWRAVSARSAQDAAAELDLRQRSPADVFASLTGPRMPEAGRLAALSVADRWDVVAHLWYASTTPDTLRTGARLYRRDCTGCHGISGRGDGPGAAALRRQAPGHGAGHQGPPKSPVDFTDLAAQAGAPDLLYYGKLIRGGMGTFMPYWGTIYREAELWAVIAHLRSLAFRFPPLPEDDGESGPPRADRASPRAG